MSVRIGVAWLTLLASASPLLSQASRVGIDVAAKKFRWIADSSHSLSHEARAHLLYAAFDIAARGPGRVEPEDTVIDAAGERAIYKRLRPDWSVERWENALEALGSIDKSRLNARAALSHDIMRSEVTRELALARAPALPMPLTNNRGLHLIRWFYGSDFLPSRTVADYEIVLAHLNGVSLEIEEMLRVMRQAQASGVMPPRILMTDVADSLRAVIVDDPLQSPYLGKFREFPASIPPADQDRLRASAVRIYSTKIKPAYERLLAYATETYIPGATESIGLSGLSGGAERYALIVQFRAKPARLSPAKLHEMALGEVARHAASIDSFRLAIGYEGDYQQFLEFLRTDSRFEFADSAAYVRAARDIAKRIDANILKLFRAIPRLPYGVGAVRAVGGAVYQRGSLVDGRAGMVRLFVSGDRPGRTWLLPVLMLHEGMPGHHLSHAVFLERELPQFQGLGSFSAFSEGWAMYAETMGSALGVYDDEYAALGQLTGNVWRAIRAVMDTGIHGLGWTWQQAFDYARRNSPHADAQIESELARIVADPGFVLGYKLGQWKFLELRALAERELGASFDVRAFNDALLENGEMPLDVLDAHMRAWVGQRKPRGN
ncbi:MAG: DUF885 domain-containing protein [Gemmatimonadaceae bacterium]